MELIYVIAGTLALGTALFALDRSRVALLRAGGPWLLVFAICVGITLLINPSRQPYSWFALQRYDFLEDMFEALAVLLSFALEALLIAYLLLRSKPRLPVFLPGFVLTSMAAWFLTFLAWSSVLED